MPDERVAIRAHVERFPLSLKGAFVLRGADGDPHQVRFESATLLDLGSREARPIDLGPLVVDVAPTLDLFVPFEIPIAELEPGWYRVECVAVVDGGRPSAYAAERFAMPWPRTAVRRGSVAIDRAVGRVRLTTIECAADHLRIGYEAASAPSVRLAVDREPHPILEVGHDPEAGSGWIVAYPVLRRHGRISVELRGHRPVVVELP
ncbi:MAG: hypothetical protein KatS3mg013_0891 [Actinomycetota bacterium]|nr:MAG: hypothetical protein KatS3mg013_0891 [Actinomycetota bacterium]